MLAKWQGMDMQSVYADWAESMQEYSLGAINHGIEQAGDLQHPPSKGEFKILCQCYKPKLPPMIDHKVSPEQLEKNRLRIAEIARTLAAKKSV